MTAAQPDQTESAEEIQPITSRRQWLLTIFCRISASSGRSTCRAPSAAPAGRDRNPELGTTTPSSSRSILPQPRHPGSACAQSALNIFESVSYLLCFDPGQQALYHGAVVKLQSAEDVPAGGAPKSQSGSRDTAVAAGGPDRYGRCRGASRRANNESSD
jgi:hypothetical protein